MDFGFSQEQDLLRQELRKLLDDVCPMAEVRRLAASESGFSREHWKRLAEMGIVGLLIPEREGGAGLSWVDAMVVLEETGRSLFPSPLVSTWLAAALIEDAGSDAQRARWLPAIAQGQVVATVAVLEAGDDPRPESIALRGEVAGDGFVLGGEKCFVQDAAAADLIVVAFRSGEAPGALKLALVEPDAGVEVDDLPALDRTRRVARVRLDAVRVAAEAVFGDAAAIARHLDRGALAVAAECIGVIEGALALTVQFARDRVQFGHPIGHFQGVKHPLAEIHVEAECLKSLCYYAAWALAGNPEDVPRAVSEAKALACLAVTRTGIDAIQLHGAVGYTEEYDVQLYLKRSKWARPLYGDEIHHQDRVASLGGY